MEISPGMPEDRALPSAPEEVNLAEHFVHLCDIQHRRVSSPSARPREWRQAVRRRAGAAASAVVLYYPLLLWFFRHAMDAAR